MGGRGGGERTSNNTTGSPTPSFRWRLQTRGGVRHLNKSISLLRRSVFLAAVGDLATQNRSIDRSITPQNNQKTPADWAQPGPSPLHQNLRSQNRRGIPRSRRATRASTRLDKNAVDCYCNSSDPSPTRRRCIRPTSKWRPCRMGRSGGYVGAPSGKVCASWNWLTACVKGEKGPYGG